MRARHIFELIVFQTFVLVIQLLPLHLVQRIGASLGVMSYKLGFRRSITLKNLSHAFPDKDQNTLESIAREAFKSVGITLFELIWTPRQFRLGLGHILEVENREVFLAEKNSGRGVLVLTAHLGNWELMAQSVAMVLSAPMLLIFKPQSNQWINRRVKAWRELCGNKLIPMDVSVREALRTLKEGGVVGMAADQTAAIQSLSVEFFGRQVPTFEGPATFSLKTGAAIVLTFAIRQPNGTYRLRFVNVPKSDLNGYNDENVAELTRRHTSLTESIIREYPGQWMWMHKRWKHVDVAEKADL